jgi:tRNA G18 (ribose-2'-O)-methylase SpoU
MCKLTGAKVDALPRAKRRAIVSRAKAHSIPVVETSTPQLHNIYGKNSDKNHQGVVLDVQPLHYIPIADPAEAITFRRVLCR